MVFNSLNSLISGAIPTGAQKIWEQTLLSAGVHPDSNISYFGFGVYNGESMRWWTTANRNADSKFVGFDSFKGLPEKWVGGSSEVGAYRAEHGKLNFDDFRVDLVEGWFSETLTEYFKAFDHDDSSTIIVMFDADLFTSTVSAMANILVQGAGSSQIWMFDEFVPEEARAFKIFVDSFDLEICPLVSDELTHHVSFLVKSQSLFLDFLEFAGHAYEVQLSGVSL